MNWGYKIMLVYVAFVAGILFMVFKSSTQKLDLVTSDYYEKELKYQEKIDELNRVAALKHPLTYEVKENAIEILLPGDFTGMEVTGEVELYCPSDKLKDRKITFSSSSLKVSLPISRNNTGMHELHVFWKAMGKTYYFDKKLII